MSVPASAAQLAPARTAPATPATFHPKRPTVLSYGLGADRRRPPGPAAAACPLGELPPTVRRKRSPGGPAPVHRAKVVGDVVLIE
ncbi:hypothetical protein HRW14_24505 [Streptomyces lunaelactis]|uniref:hypothetical protein n=1 Tax=Streptomyces lunaelactis TaxID=1535768 RepID=UPI001584C337|nr:hypothetical protein [Streptomyces lunaelactis]NUK53377.1 hypothetical protein [Streptomyces lunaelactis]